MIITNTEGGIDFTPLMVMEVVLLVYWFIIVGGRGGGSMEVLMTMVVSC